MSHAIETKDRPEISPGGQERKEGRPTANLSIGTIIFMDHYYLGEFPASSSL